LKGKQLEIHYEATTDESTIVNLTHHPFFNLNGSGSTTLEDHFLHLEANRYLPVREDMIPAGTICDVKGTPFDFRLPALLTDRLRQEHEQLQRGYGFDHCFVRNGYKTGQSGLAATAWSKRTGIGMRIHTTEPGVQLYTGNFMDGTNLVKLGGTDVFRSAFCLETQHFPDSPNQPQFPSVELHPGQVYQSSTTFEFFNSETSHSL
jgi:aldose 1-epimerase